ncbi:hypothetical protein ACU05E_004363 [Escherichia coli]
MAPDTTTGRDPPQRREARFAKRRCALHPGGLLPGCRERRPRRDRGGATEAARPERSLQARGFASGMEARQGDARKRHCQENNKTDNNQGSSNQSQNRRKKRIIKEKVM